MKNTHKGPRLAAIVALVTFAGSAMSSRGQTPADSELTSSSAFADAVAGYIYAFPLVMMGVTERVVTNVPKANAKMGRSPINQFATPKGLPDASYSDVVLPSTSTLYASAFLDLSAEPIVFQIPDELNHFYLMQLLDAWTNVSPNSPGTRLGSQPGNYVFTGPNWKGTDSDLPSGATRIPMPTNTMWIIGRTYTDGTDGDVQQIVNEVFTKYTLTPLSKFGQGYTPPDNIPVDPSIDTTTPPANQVQNMDACTFFGTFAAMTTTNMPLPADQAIVNRLANIQVFPGQPFDCSTLDANLRRTLQLAVVAAKLILQNSPSPSLTATNWSMPLNLGDYGTQYLLRALVALKALGANSTDDAVYAVATEDVSGNTLTGANRYTLHFSPKTTRGLPGELPPVNMKAFWSVTLYNAPKENLFNSSVVNYNAIGIPQIQAHDACLNSDGSLDLYVQADPPSDPNQFCNWIPAPSGDFLLFLRMYWPDTTITQGPWIPPAVRKVN